MALFKLDIIKLRGIQAFLLPAAMFVFLVALYVVNQGFFWTFRKKSRQKNLKNQGKTKKIKPKAQKVGTFFKLSDVFARKITSFIRKT